MESNAKPHNGNGETHVAIIQTATESNARSEAKYADVYVCFTEIAYGASWTPLLCYYFS